MEEKKQVAGIWRIIAIAALCACAVLLALYASKPAAEEPAAQEGTAQESAETPAEGAETEPQTAADEDPLSLWSDDAPLKKALLDKGLCEDVSLGVDSMMQFEASFVAKNVKAENVAAVRTTLRETLEALAAKGLDHARLTAILDRAEFRDREKDMGD